MSENLPPQIGYCVYDFPRFSAEFVKARDHARAAEMLHAFAQSGRCAPPK
jgi:hypothetical protein